MKCIQSLLLFAAISIQECLSANCTLCPDGSLPTDPDAKLVLDKGQVITCSKAHEEALKGYFANCTNLHQRSIEICGCGKPPEKKCSLCENKDLPLPDKIISGKKCSEWEGLAAKGFAEDCFSWQQTFGNSCGCKNPKVESFCYICDKELPFVEKKVNFTDKKEKTCIEIEREENAKIATKQTNCSAEQARYLNICDCNPQPTQASIKTSLAILQKLNIYSFVALVTYLLSLKVI